jgi:hypothetical protein
MGRQQMSNLAIPGAAVQESYVAVCNGLFYFNVNNSLYSYDGTPVAPTLVGSNHYPAQLLICYDNKLIGKRRYYDDIYMYDGDTSKLLAVGFENNPPIYGLLGSKNELFVYNNLLYFCGGSSALGLFPERELIVADTLGHAANLEVNPSLNQPPFDQRASNPSGFVEFQGKLYFCAADSTYWHMWTLTCDNFIDTNLNYNSFNNRLTAAQISSTSFPTTYQWVRCDSGYASTAGATNKYFDLTFNGSYAVIMNRFGCIDTSMCFSMNTFGLDEEDENPILVFPNPTNGDIQINASGSIKKVTMYSSLGESIVELFPDIKNPMIAMPEQSGIYYLRIEDENGSIFTKKVVRL